MIKKFNEYINEDYFSKLASRKENGNVRRENFEDFVRSFVEKGYERDINSISIRKENDKTIVDIDGDFYLIQDVEEIPFQFGTVTGDFNCDNCKKLKSLKGCPREIHGEFNANGCLNIESLEGGPKIVNKGYICSNCKNLKSLDGCPKEVNYYFTCFGCTSLKSLDGCPKIINGNGGFYCRNCGRQFTEDEVKSLCNVNGRIDV